MSKLHAGGQGTFGGLAQKHDDSETSEGRRFRPADNLDDTLKDFVTNDIGPHILNKSFQIENYMMRTTEITFDRLYPKHKLLTHSFARRVTYADLNDDVVNAEIEIKRSYAIEHGYRFLAVVDGEVERDDLLRLRMEITALNAPTV